MNGYQKSRFWVDELVKKRAYPRIYGLVDHHMFLKGEAPMEIEADFVELENPFTRRLECIRGISAGAVGRRNPEEDAQ